MLEVLKIVFNKIPAVYTPGETITGNVVLQLIKPAVCQGITLRFSGMAKVGWRGWTDDDDHTQMEEYFRKEIHVAGHSNRRMQMAAGTNILPFAFPLPTNIPNSFEHKYGFVAYKIKVILGEPWAAHNPMYVPFTVYSPFELSNFASRSITDEMHKNYRCCLLPCLSAGFMGVRIYMAKDHYYTGERIDVFVNTLIHSNSIDILGIDLELRQRIKFSAGSATKSVTVILQKVVQSGPFRRSKSFQLGLPIPSLVHSALDYCSIINITHQIGIKFFALGGHRDMKREYEIKVGSEPSVCALPNASMAKLTNPEMPSTSYGPPPIGFKIPGCFTSTDTDTWV